MGELGLLKEENEKWCVGSEKMGCGTGLLYIKDLENYKNKNVEAMMNGIKKAECM